ncbi:hypothetical protein HX882_04605 [Pseudomonas gingeri]|uniref:Uncharacterized protein n=1 Tax=Pseudomonas gingeri TaxID=117681 RepID=A0A7Y7XAK3_9PSED|nr:hypothetical protein [Pseudomonas gingeri]NWB95173.1 hypothetical protein [Pseudomonas gingeri]
MLSEMEIFVEGMSKHYHLYKKPFQRLLQMFTGRGRQYFKACPVLDDTSFQIRKGETVGIIVGNSYTPGTGASLVVADRIVNAIIFNVSCHKEICTLTYFDTTFSIDWVP